MEIPTTTSSGTASASAASALANGSSSTKTSIANNFDQFLQLLTTQLKNQSPLDPLDTNQFTQQLVQFASVEQQLKTNDTLTALLSLSKATTVSNGLSYVGATVRADGSTSPLVNGQAQWSLEAPSAGSATIVIKNKAGDEIASTTRSLAAGKQQFSWNGTRAGGGQAPPGEYTIVVTAKDASAQPMTVKTEVTGVVDGVLLDGEQPVLTIGSFKVPVDKVRSVVRAQ
jgi:flagellar basal-body rod modification protein FlgD